MKNIKKIKQFLSVLLVVLLFLQQLYGIKVAAEGEEPTPTPQESVEPASTVVPEQTEVVPTETVQSNEPTPTEVSTQTEVVSDPTPTPGNNAEADSSQTTEVTNNDNAEVNNNVGASANTGENVIVDPTTTPIPETPGSDSTFEETVTPTPSDAPTDFPPVPTPSVYDEESVTVLPTEAPLLTDIPTLVPILTEAGNVEGGDGVVNFSDSSQETAVVVENNNDAEVGTSAEAASNTGENFTEGKDSETTTGDSQATANVANVVNTNLIGSDFWQLILNLFATGDNDIDLTKIEGFQSFDPALISVLAQNDQTGDGSVNIALANILSSYTVLNNNNAQVTNNVDVSANSGDNQADGKRSSIDTGDASAEANVFNLVNTNLIGSSWFFSIINMFAQQNGDLILPYELQYLLGDNYYGGIDVSAINKDTGDGSQNQAQASSVDSTTINNNNQATVNNNIDATSNSGNNTIVGEDGSISTGNAKALVDLVNIVNTNIYGSHWLLLAINNYGSWTGDLLGWWGNKVTIGNTTYLWVKLPDDSTTGLGSVTAANQQTGDESINQAIASQTTSFQVINNNTAQVENNITVSTDTGNNQITGKDSEIKTGEAKAVANVANIVNTNIIGNNWFFGVINIFNNFTGNIIFPRPDLTIIKSANKTSALSGEEIQYSISYKDQGRLWAKDVVVEDILPAELEFISAGNGGVLQENKVVWNLGKIEAGQGQVLTVTVRVKSGISIQTTTINNVLIKTSTDEPDKNNNNASFGVLVGSELSPTPTPTDTNGQPTPTPTGTTEQPTPTPTEEVGRGGAENTLGTSSSNNDGGGGENSCTPPQAPSAPVLVSATNISGSEVKLTWVKVDRATHYLVSYGDFSGHYLYGNPDVGNTDSYTVGSLAPGKNYYFVVAAVIGGDCPVAGPYSNELQNGYGTGGQIFGISDLSDATGENEFDGDLGGGTSTESGEVAGATSKGACPVWWIVLLGQTLALGGFYGFLLVKGKSLRYWYLPGPALVIASVLIDRYAHTHIYDVSKYCPFEPLTATVIAGIETVGFKLLKKS